MFVIKRQSCATQCTLVPCLLMKALVLTQLKWIYILKQTVNARSYFATLHQLAAF
jgi:hypothetical protein